MLLRNCYFFNFLLGILDRFIILGNIFVLSVFYQNSGIANKTVLRLFAFANTAQNISIYTVKAPRSGHRWWYCWVGEKIPAVPIIKATFFLLYFSIRFNVLSSTL